MSDVFRWRVVVSAPYACACIDRYRRALEQGGCDVVLACATERLEEDDLLRLLPARTASSAATVALPAVSWIRRRICASSPSGAPAWTRSTWTRRGGAGSRSTTRRTRSASPLPIRFL